MIAHILEFLLTLKKNLRSINRRLMLLNQFCLSRPFCRYSLTICFYYDHSRTSLQKKTYSLLLMIMLLILLLISFCSFCSFFSSFFYCATTSSACFCSCLNSAGLFTALWSKGGSLVFCTYLK